MSEHLGEDFLIGMVVGSAVNRQRNLLANQIGAAVAANLNPPHELTQEHGLQEHETTQDWIQYFHCTTREELLEYFEDRPWTLGYLPQAERDEYKFQLKARQAAQDVGSRTPAAITASSAADEIRKLAELVAEGLLTEEEFATAKTRLLGSEGAL